MQGPAVLHALQGACTVSSLTQLVLTDLQLPNAARILPTLGSFAALRSLTVECAGGSGLCALPDPFAAAVARLTRLTSLTVESLACSPSPLYLPVSLVELHATIECCARDAPLQDGREPFVLSHLTKLVDFDAMWFVESGEAGIPQLALPPQLTRFHQNMSRVDGLLPVGLRHLRVTDPGRFPMLIQQLRDLPCLTMLEVDLITYQRGADHGLAPLLAVLPACTRLTGLCVLDLVPGRAEELVGLPWGRAVGRLTRLQQLAFVSVEFSPEDALHLSSLTALTDLKFVEAAGVDDTVLCALAVGLTNLVSLQVLDCGLSSPAPLPVVATLTKLRDLALTGKWGSALSNSGLTLLSTLTGLTRLQLPYPHRMTRSGIHSFVQRMPHLDRVL